MTLKSDAKFKEKLTLGSVPKMTRGIWWILTRAVESLKMCTLMGYCCRHYVMFELKKCEKMTYGFKNDISNLMLGKSSVYNVLAEGMHFLDKCISWTKVAHQISTF